MNHAASNVLHILAQNARPAPRFGKYQAKPVSIALDRFKKSYFQQMKKCSSLLTPAVSAPKLILCL
jgi:hypothetical protein